MSWRIEAAVEIMRERVAGERNISSPAILYDLDIIERNTLRAIEVAGGAEHLWPHVKSHKSESIIRMQMRMGIKRFKCATIAEAEMTAGTGAEAVVLAYPLVGPNIRRFAELITKFPECTFYCIGDDLEVINLIDRELAEYGVRTKLLLDVNLGMNRTGVNPERAVSLMERLNSCHAPTLAGFHCYDGHRHEKDYGERLRCVENSAADIRKLIQAYEAMNDAQTEYYPTDADRKKRLNEPLVIVGGSPSFPCYAELLQGDNVFYSPGTVFIYDAGYQAGYPDLPYEPAACVLTRVVSHPAPGVFTIDCGYKAVSAEQEIPGILPSLPHAEVMFQSEEHWTWHMQPGYEEERPDIGTVLYVIPWHVCPTTALYDEIVTVRNGRISGTIKVTARGRRL